MAEKQIDLLFKCMKMILESNVLKDVTPSEWVRRLMYFHTKGWLYCSFNGDEVETVGAIYRVPEFNENDLVYPEEEKGHIGYIPFFVSKAKSIFKARKLLKAYTDKTPEVTEIVYYKRNKDLRRFKIHNKE